MRHGIKIFRIVILYFMLLISMAFTADHGISWEQYEFERMWPISHMPWSLFNLQGIVADRKGFVYVADWGNRCVLKFNLDGGLITAWGSPGQGKDGNPNGIGVDNLGNVYVCMNEGLIQKFSSEGELLLEFEDPAANDGEKHTLTDIAGDEDGNIYVADGENFYIKKFDSDGRLLTRWGGQGDGDGRFNHYDRPDEHTTMYNMKIAIDSNGFVYVTDIGNHRIQKFDSDGIFVSKWGIQGSGEGELFTPIIIDADIEGNIYVLESVCQEGERIQKFNSDGVFITKIAEAPDFVDAHDITIDENGHVYVLELRGRILKFDQDGERIAKWGGDSAAVGAFYYPIDVALDMTGFVYVSDSGNNRIQKFSPEGSFIEKWDTGSISSIAVDGIGNIYGVGESRILKFNQNGQLLNEWGSKGDNDGQFKWFLEIAIDSIGNIYVSDILNNRIQKFDSDGAFIKKWGKKGD